MAITPFKVIQGHRFWYQSKAHIQIPISILESYNNLKQEAPLTAKSTARPSCLVGVLYTFFSGENLFMANQLLLRNWPRKPPNSAK